MPDKLTIKQHRLIRGLTQEEMSEKIGVHINTYRNWEECPGKINMDKARKIVQAFGITIDEIFFDD